MDGRRISQGKSSLIYDREETFFPFSKESQITLPKEPEGAEMACKGINACPLHPPIASPALR
jgi:hypothetical protein